MHFRGILGQEKEVTGSKERHWKEADVQMEEEQGLVIVTGRGEHDVCSASVPPCSCRAEILTCTHVCTYTFSCIEALYRH